LRHSDADQFTSRLFEPMNLVQDGFELVGIRRRHRLDDDRIITANRHAADIDDPRLVAAKRGLIEGARSASKRFGFYSGHECELQTKLRSQALPGNALLRRLCLRAMSARQSLAIIAFPGEAWERGRIPITE